MPSSPARRLVGTYDLGCRKVRLYALPGASGGTFDSGPDCGIAQIEVAIGFELWSEVVVVLMHEAFEASCSELSLRYRSSPDYSNSSGGWVFFMTHEQMSEAIARSGWFVAAALPALAKVFNAKGRREKKGS